MIQNRYKKKIIFKRLVFACIVLFNIYGFAQDPYSFSDNIRFEVILEPDSFLYVDDDNTSGPWTGTENFPFENIPEALVASSTGVTVVVKPGNYPINQNITVPTNVKLFLFHGDTLVFGANNNLQINGRLQAFGQSNDSIYFTSTSPFTDWDGIRFINSQLQSELRYCQVTRSIGTDGNKGGGIYTSNSNVKLFGSKLKNNSANYGAGIYCENNSIISIEECLLVNNTANINGGGFYGTAMDSLKISNTKFESNTAITSGGGIALLNSPVYLSQSEFMGNGANNGGGIHFNNVTADSTHLSWNILKSNSAIAGGGLYAQNCNLLNGSRNLFQANFATNGGGIYLNNSQINFYNNTVFSNAVTNQGGGFFSDGGNNEILNNIIWENTSSDDSQISGTGINANYNNVEGGYAGTDNISAYPLFVDTTNGNFNLQIKSPCINAGNPANLTDPDSTILDLGIYYFYHHLAEVTDQPADATVTEGYNVSFSIQANWALDYQWQVSINDGISWEDISDPVIYSDFTSNNLQLSNVPFSIDGYKYRCKVFGAGTSPILTEEVSLTVHPVIKTFAANTNTCEGDILFPITVSNCNSVGAISLVMSYNNTMLTFTGFQNQHSELASGNLIVNAFNGNIYISWASITAANIGNDLLLELMFTTLQGSSNLVWDTITSGNCEYGDINGNVILSTYANGSTFSSQCNTQLDVKLFLEGPYNGADMDVGVSHLLPVSQPFSGSPWNYSGTENVPIIPNGNIVDWGLIEIRETAGDASTATESTIVSQQAVFILKDGKIKSVDGSNLPKFNQVITDNLFVVIRQRNHLSVMSGNPVTITGNAYSYNFTTASGQAYGGSSGHTEIGAGIWGMMAGDGDANGLIDINDKNNIWAVEAGTKGYLMGDFDLNEHVDNKDKNDGWAPNNGSSTQLPD